VTEVGIGIGDLENTASGRAKYPDVPVSQDLVHGHPGRALADGGARRLPAEPGLE
jgi:hypothetical protein